MLKLALGYISEYISSPMFEKLASIYKLSSSSSSSSSSSFCDPSTRLIFDGVGIDLNRLRPAEIFQVASTSQQKISADVEAFKTEQETFSKVCV